MTERTFQRLGVAAAICFGAWTAFAGMARLSLWFDEGYTAWAISHPPGEIMRLIRADTAPPLYYILLHFWDNVFGNSEAALRGFSAVLGIAAIPLVAAIAKHLLANSRAVVVSAWLFVLGFLHVWYSQEARSYELSVFLAAMMTYALLRHLNRPDWRWITLLIACAGASLYVNNFMILYVVAIAAAGLVFPSTMSAGRRARDFSAAAAGIALIYLPWLAPMRAQMHRVNSYFWIQRPTADDVCNVLARAFGVGHFWSWDKFIHPFYYNVEPGVPRAAILILVIALSIGVIRASVQQRRILAGLAICALLPPLAAALYSQFNRSIFLFAAFTPSTVPAAILMAAPLAWGRTTWARIVVAMCLVLNVVNLAAFEHERKKEDWRGAAAAVMQMPTAKHRLIIFLANEAQLPFDYYFRPRQGDVETGAPAGFFDVDPPVTQRRVLADPDLDGLRKQLSSGLFDDVVLVLSHQGYADPDNRTIDLLNEHTRMEEQLSFYNVTVWRCAPTR